MKKIIKDLIPLNRVFCSTDYDKAIEYLQKHLPFKVIEFTEGCNGWVIPPKWDVKKAVIKRSRLNYFEFDGKGRLGAVYHNETIFEATHPLSIIGLSKSFNGRMSLEELQKHLHYHEKYDAIPYHYSQSYNSWRRDWGFCVTRRFYDSLEPGEYEVVIETEESEGALKICEYTHKGELPETFVFVAHLDHSGMANDDLAGCAVGIELFKRLPKTKYTYKLLLVQEIIGSELYLSQAKDNFVGGVFLEMLGSRTPLILQESYIGSCFDFGETRRGKFGKVIGNDEVVWEAHGIPMDSLSRFPYPEYHTSLDNASIISEESLEESVQLLLKVIGNLEKTKIVFKKFTGYPCLSRYGLYVGMESRLRSLMEFVPMMFRPMTVSQLADKFNLLGEEVLEYLSKWADRGLLEIK